MRSLGEAEQRIDELEVLIAEVRHDLNGALTPALLAVERLYASPDPRIRQAGERIAASVLRATSLMTALREVVPAMEGQAHLAAAGGSGAVGVHDAG